MTAGPSGWWMGITRIMEVTTWIQPSSWSAIACRVNIDDGGSWSLLGEGKKKRHFEKISFANKHTVWTLGHERPYVST